MPPLASARTPAYRLGLAWVLACAPPSQAWADTGFAPPAVAVASVEISGGSSPLDTLGESQRLDVTRWMSPGSASSLGFTLGLALPTRSNLLPHSMAPAPWGMDIGVRWRTQLGSGRHLDMAAWTRTAYAGQEPDAMGMIWHREQGRFGTRVEVQWTNSRTRGLVPEFGAIGVQLEGHSRLLLRARGGGPMVYYRTKF